MQGFGGGKKNLMANQPMRFYYFSVFLCPSFVIVMNNLISEIDTSSVAII